MNFRCNMNTKKGLFLNLIYTIFWIILMIPFLPIGLIGILCEKYVLFVDDIKKQLFLNYGKK